MVPRYRKSSCAGGLAVRTMRYAGTLSGMSDAPDNVVRLHVAEVGDGAAISPDQIPAAAATKYRSLVLVGESDDGTIEVCGSHGAPESLMLLAWAQNFLVENRVAR